MPKRYLPVPGLVLDPAKCSYIKRDGTQCKNLAGKGTDHLGQGCCKWHGGAGRPKIHGRRSKFVYPTVKEKVEEFLEDEELASTDYEIARLKAMQHEIDEQIEEFKPLTEAELSKVNAIDKDLGKKIRHMNDMCGKYNAFSKQIESILATDKLVNKRVERIEKSQYAITLEELPVFIEQLYKVTGEILNEYIPNEILNAQAKNELAAGFASLKILPKRIRGRQLIAKEGKSQ